MERCVNCATQPLKRVPGFVRLGVGKEVLCGNPMMRQDVFAGADVKPCIGVSDKFHPTTRVSQKGPKQRQKNQKVAEAGFKGCPFEGWRRRSQIRRSDCRRHVVLNRHTSLPSVVDSGWSSRAD